MNYKVIDTCRCCGSSGLQKYLDLGMQPLANNYTSAPTEQEKFPLEVNFCEVCTHSQLSIVVDPKMMFDDYLYVSGTTQTLKDHFDELAYDAMARQSSYNTKPRVLDIACNDGTLLESFRSIGAEVLGVDPAKNLRPLTEEKSIPVEVGYWDEDVAASLGTQFDIITATNVFAHVNDAAPFLELCKKYLYPGGIVVLEFPYLENMILHNEFDTIYHEHLSYFTVGSMMHLCDRVGLNIADIKLVPIHGGSIRFYLTKQHGTWRETSNSLSSSMSHELRGKLNKIETYTAFADRVEENKNSFKMLKELLEYFKIVGYGAAAKSSTSLNYFDETVSYIVDDNPLKCGKFTPGKNIPIVPTDELYWENDEIGIVIFSWNFADEIIKKIKDIRKGDLAMFYVPNVNVKIC